MVLDARTRTIKEIILDRLASNPLPIAPERLLRLANAKGCYEDLTNIKYRQKFYTDHTRETWPEDLPYPRKKRK